MLTKAVNCLVNRHASKRFINLNRLNSSQAQQVAKKSSFRRLALYSSVASTSALVVYYELALSAQEKRRARVNIESIGRAFRSLRTGLQIIIDYKWNLWNLDDKSDEYNTAIKGCHLRSAQLLVKTCILNGGMYVKMGQGLSTMNHILPKEFYTTLRSLQNEALRSKGTDIDNLFLEEFNKLPLEVFKEFDYKPIAAASLAQVHTAMSSTGEKLAVKLQYIDLRDRFNGDFFTCKYLLQLVGFVFPAFNFSWVLDELRDTIYKELDFENEAQNSKRCYNELKHLGFVHVPKVNDNLTTKRILTMEFIDGINIGNTSEIKKQGFNLKELDQNLIKMFGEQIFNSGFVHADPHHGNIMIRKKKGTKNSAEIVLLDHGLYCYINSSDRKKLCNLWKSIILKDENKMKLYSKLLNVEEEHYLTFSVLLTMRELHRPIHPMFIFAKDWTLMSQAEKEKASEEGKMKLPSRSEFVKMTREDWKEWRKKVQPYLDEIHESFLHVLRNFPKSLLLVCRFCDMLTMEPNFNEYMSKKNELRFKENLSEQEIEIMRDTLRKNFDKVQVILQQVSSYMLLVFRNLNTVRSIVHDHGNLVDRHTIMARIAVMGAYKDQMKLGWKQRICAWLDLTRFDIILAYDQFYRWTVKVYIHFLVRFNIIPREMISELAKAQEEMHSMK